MTAKLRVLVVDDSRAIRERIVRVVEKLSFADVVGIATDGESALRLSRELSPDVVTLDLEMPKLGGYSFLRILMATRPMPILVVSGNSDRDSVIRALELGALDFIPKSESDPERFERLLVAKLSMIPEARVPRPSHPPPAASHPPVTFDGSKLGEVPHSVVAIAASTGGPGAIMDLLQRVRALEHCAILIAQHMPPRFTTAFAERLARHTQLVVSEASDGNLVSSKCVFVCPGERCMELERLSTGRLRVRIALPEPHEHYVPNASRLLVSVGRVMGPGAIGVVLTGMGDDGADGARAIADAGGRVLIESAETAVINGMPEAAARRVPTAPRVPLSILPERIAAVVNRRGRVVRYG